MRVLCLLVLAGLTGTGLAETSAPPAQPSTTPTSHEDETPLAIGVSAPWGWPRDTFGASLYVGLSDHYALRGNFARYHYSAPVLGSAASAASGGDIDFYSGQIQDVGMGWVIYPGKLWEGLMFEAGVLWRSRETGREDDADDVLKTRSNTYAGRALIGWTWRFAGSLFVAVAGGASVGYESGRETHITLANSPDAMSTTNSVHRAQVDAEGYVRVGFAFGR